MQEQTETRYRAAYEAFQTATRQYRDRTIGDAEYLAARAAFENALAEWELEHEMATVIENVPELWGQEQA